MRAGRDWQDANENRILPLLDAVIWLARRFSGKPGSPPIDQSTEAWAVACENARLQIIRWAEGSKLTIYGLRRGRGELQAIKGENFSGLDAATDRVGANKYLMLIGPAEDTEAGGGRFQDKLFLDGDPHGGPTWTGLSTPV